jgi:hypothetical protein
MGIQKIGVLDHIDSRIGIELLITVVGGQIGQGGQQRNEKNE